MRDLSWFEEYSLGNTNNISDDKLKQEINERFNRIMAQKENTTIELRKKNPTLLLTICWEEVGTENDEYN